MLSTTNEDGRSGAYFLPKGYNIGSAVLPILVLFHGTDMTGQDMLDFYSFLDLARQYKFIIIAPDSHEIDVSGTGDKRMNFAFRPGAAASRDVIHATKSIREVLDMPGVRRENCNVENILSAGYSGGASMGAIFSLIFPGNFSSMAVLHGSIAFIPSPFYGFEESKFNQKAWLSTGEDDDVIAPSFTKESADDLEKAGLTVTYTEYEGVKHGLEGKEESDLIKWWLDS